MNMPGLKQVGDVAIGAAIRAGEETAGAVERLRTARPPVTAARLRERLEALRRRGEAERSRSQGALDRAVDAAMTAFAASPLVNRIVEVQVIRVLALLEEEPDRIRVLVRGQRDSVVGEMVGRVRTGAAAGDAAVDRFTLRMSRRGGAGEPT